MSSDSNQDPTVFIVDDESVVRDSLRLVVQTMGFSVKCFSSAIEFLDFIKPHDISRPVCLITDIMMPQTSGIELLDQLRALGKKLSVIMITGHGTTALKHKAKESGAIAFLEKPFRPAELQEILTTILKQETRAGFKTRL